MWERTGGVYPTEQIDKDDTTGAGGVDSLETVGFHVASRPGYTETCLMSTDLCFIEAPFNSACVFVFLS